ncbi:MAG: DJ-1/PfpI family protein [Pseudolabrys sp.]
MARRKTARPGGSNGSCRDGDGLLDVVVVILEGGYTSTAVAPIEIFHSAGVVWNWLHGEATKPRFRVRTASVDGRSVKSVCALGLTPDCALSVIKKADIIIVPASGWDAIDLIAKNTPLLPWLKKWHDRGAYIAGVCTGVAFLAECGMLDGKRVTTHWGLADILGERYPKVRWQPEQFVTEDGRLFCSGGVYTAIDLSLYLVEKFCGHEIALQCAKSLLLSMPRGPAVWIFSRTIVASAFRREDQTKRGIPAATFRPRHFDRHSRQAGRNGPAQFHPPFQGSDRPRAGRLPPDTQSLGRKGNALTRHRVDSGRQLENRLGRYRVLPQSVQASHRHDAR